MKKMTLSILALLFSVTAGAANELVCDSLVVSGNCMAQLSQRVETSLRNNSDCAYEGRLYLSVHNKDNGNLTLCLDTLITIAANKVQQLVLYPTLPEGNLELRLTTDVGGQQVMGTCDVTILPLRKLNFKATFSLDMLTKTEGEAALYGSRIKGWVQVENYETPYYGINGGKADDDGIVLWLEDCDTGGRLFTKHIANGLEYNSTWVAFAYDAVFRDGTRYALKAGYGMPYGLEPIDSLCFTMRMGTNTYWTANGEVLPLPLNDNRQLTVPEEAVAVDLRGTAALPGIYTVDASQANPNCLYYLDLPDNVPQGLDESRNLVRGLEAENIRLTEGYDYYCPLAFRTQFISFMMTPSYNNPDDEACGRGYSETIVLPFRPSHVGLYESNRSSGSRRWTADGDSIQSGPDEMLHSDMLAVLRYYGHQADSLNVVQLSSLSQLKAYEPYILGVFIGSSLLFIGENTQVPATSEAIVRGSGIDFIGTTVQRRLSRTAFTYCSDGFRFRQGETDDCVPSFHAYIAAADDITYEELNIPSEVWGSKGNPNDATAIQEIFHHLKPNTSFGQRTHDNEGTQEPPHSYDLSGRNLPANLLPDRHLQKGIYIVGGRKVVVK